MSRPSLIICLASYEPPARLWRRQLATLKAQSYQDWACLVQDDASSPAAFARLKASLKGDRRFQLRRNPRRLGAYRNFERALSRVPKDIRYVALCDQDDAWYPQKLAHGIAELESSGAQLVHSNLRLVDPAGKVLAPGSWIAGANRVADLESLSISNIVTGASALFRRSLLDAALPFPSGPGRLLHDQWLALVALSLGSLAYLSEPQYDYVQHRRNHVGYGAPWVDPGDLRQAYWFLKSLRGPQRALLLSEASRQHAEHLQRAELFASELRRRLTGRLKPGAEGQLARVQAAAQSLPALLMLWARGRWRGRDVFGIETHLLLGALRLRLAGRAVAA